MASLIDPTKPAAPIALCEDMRANFSRAKSEIEALQGAGPYLPLTGGTVSGPTIHSGTMTLSGGGTFTGTYAGAHSYSGTISLSAGLLFGSATAASTSDLSKHLALFSTTYGMNVTSNRLNYAVPASAGHVFNVAGTDVATINTAGLTVAGGTFTGTFAGAHTYSGAITHSAAYTNTFVGAALTVQSNATISGSVTLANGLGNGVQFLGHATNPTIQIGGTGTNGALLLRGQGTGAVNIGNTTNGNSVQILDGGTGAFNALVITANAAGTATTIRPADSISGIQINNTATGKLGFNGAAVIAKPTLTGAKGSNAALASVIAALIAYGLVIDTTTA